MSQMQGVNQATSTSSRTSKSTALEKIEFHMSRKPFFPLNGSNFKPQNRYVSDPPRRPNANLECGLDNDVKFHMIVRRIGAGLENLGNTCFLNSVLQCLTHTEPLVAYLLSGKHQNSCHIVGFCALCAIQKHVVRSLQSSGRILAPKDLVSNLRRISRNFRNARQEDAHEYMVHLLESMHKCCLPSGIPYESPSAYEKSLVHKIFGGCLRSQVKCMQCSYCSNKFDPFLDLSLEIAKADSLHKALSHFTAAEQLDGGERQYQCQQCKQKVRASKQLTIDKAPYVLAIHLKRFGSHISGQKIDKKVQFGPTLNLKPYVSGSYGDELKYTLYGVLVHAGWSTHSGHYYCFVRTSGGVWYNLDDSRVYQVSERTVLEQKAYMLFYVRDGMNFGPRSIGNAGQGQKIISSNMPNGLSFKTTPHGYMSADKPVNAAQKKAGAVAVVNGLSSGSAANQGLRNKPGGGSVIGVQDEKGAATALQKRGGEEDSERLQNAMPAKKLRGIGAPDDAFVESHPSNVQSSDKSFTSKGLVQEPDSKDLSQSSIERKSSDLVLKSNVQHLTHLRKCIVVDPPAHNDAATAIEQNISVISAEKTLKSDLCLVVKSSDKPADLVADMILKSHDKAGIPPEEAVAKQLYSKHDLGRSGSEVNNIMDGLLSEPSKRSLDQKVRRKSLKYKVPSMRLCTRVLYGASLSLRERRKHRKFQKGEHKVSRNPIEEESVPSTSHLNAAVIEVSSKRSRKGSRGSTENGSDYARDNGISASEDFVSELKRRMAVVSATACDSQHLEGSKVTAIPKQQQSGQPCRIKESVNTMRGGVVDNPTKSSKISAAALRGSVVLPSSGLTDSVSIGYAADEWDEQYDRGKRKKVKTSKEAAFGGGPNPLQAVATKAGKSKVKRKQYNLANQPYRI